MSPEELRSLGHVHSRNIVHVTWLGFGSASELGAPESGQ